MSQTWLPAACKCLHHFVHSSTGQHQSCLRLKQASRQCLLIRVFLQLPLMTARVDSDHHYPPWWPTATTPFTAAAAPHQCTSHVNEVHEAALLFCSWILKVLSTKAAKLVLGNLIWCWICCTRTAIRCCVFIPYTCTAQLQIAATASEEQQAKSQQPSEPSEST